MLSITHFFPYEYSAREDRGILYWLGSERAKDRKHRIPQAIGDVAVHVGRLGDVSLNDKSNLVSNYGNDGVFHGEAFLQKSRKVLVQHRPLIFGDVWGRRDNDVHEPLQIPYYCKPPICFATSDTILSELNVDDSHRVASTIEHYEPHVDFDLLLERSGNVAAATKTSGAIS